MEAWTANPTPEDPEADSTVLEAMVPRQNLGAFEAKLQALQKKARKLRVEVPGYEVGEEIVTQEAGWIPHPYAGMTMVDAFGERTEIPYGTQIRVPRKTAFPVRVWGKAPMIEGWRMIGVVTPVEGGNLLTPSPLADEAALAPYRKASLYCDHCQCTRRRKETFVLQSTEDGRTIQVGRQCLKDFIGHADPKALLNAATVEWSLADLARDAEHESWLEEELARGEPGAKLVDYLAAVWEAIQSFGWVPSSAAGREERATKIVAQEILAGGKGQPKISPEAVAMAEATRAEALGYLTEKDESGRALSNYEANLQLALQGDVMTSPRRTMGIAASVYAYVNKARDRLFEAQRRAERESRQREASQYFGTVGQRGTWLMDLTGLFYGEGDYGPWTLLKFETVEPRFGDAAIWFASGVKEEDRGTYTVVATVKRHEIDKRSGVPTTHLSRVKLYPAAEYEKRRAKTDKAAARKTKPKGPPKKGTKAWLAAEIIQLSTLLQETLPGAYVPSEKGLKKFSKGQLEGRLEQVYAWLSPERTLYVRLQEREEPFRTLGVYGLALGSGHLVQGVETLYGLPAEESYKVRRLYREVPIPNSRFTTKETVGLEPIPGTELQPGMRVVDVANWLSWNYDQAANWEEAYRAEFLDASRSWTSYGYGAPITKLLEGSQEAPRFGRLFARTASDNLMDDDFQVDLVTLMEPGERFATGIANVEPVAEGVYGSGLPIRTPYGAASALKNWLKYETPEGEFPHYVHQLWTGLGWTSDLTGRGAVELAFTAVPPPPRVTSTNPIAWY